MTPLEAGSEHNLLGGRTVGDPHPQYVLKKSQGLAGGGLPAGTTDQTLAYGLGGFPTEGWRANSILKVDMTAGLVSILGSAGAFITAGSECTGPWLLHGANEVGKLAVAKSGPGAEIFNVDTSNDVIGLHGNLVLRRVAVSSTPYTVLSRDTYISALAGASVFNLPTAASRAGRLLAIKNRSGGVITITPSGADTIDGVGASITPAPNAAVWLISNGASDWEVL